MWVRLDEREQASRLRYFRKTTPWVFWLGHLFGAGDPLGFEPVKTVYLLTHAGDHAVALLDFGFGRASLTRGCEPARRARGHVPRA